MPQANPYYLLHRRHEDLAIANLAGARRLDYGLDRGLHGFIVNNYFNLDFGQEIHDVFGTAIKLGVAFLPSETLHLGDGKAGHPHVRQRLANFVEFEGLDDGFDLLHFRFPLNQYSS